MKKLFVIMNGKSSRRKKQWVETYLYELKKSPYEIEVLETKHAGHATVLAKEALEKGVEYFGCMGGDGTNFEILNGLFPLAIDRQVNPKLVLLPLGTGNSFLKDFSKTEAMHSLGALAQNKKIACDIIQTKHVAGTFYFMNLLSLGFVADVAFLRNQAFSALGQVGYVVAVILKTLALRPTMFRYDIEGKSYDTLATFLSFNNSKFTGGNMMMAPNASTGDGKMDMIHVAPMGRLELLSTFPKIFTGNHLENPKVTERQLAEIQFRMQEAIPVMVDGETMKIRLESMKMVPQALEVFA